MASKVEVAVRSDMGCVRKNNEDNFGYDPGHGLYVVCDGMGGVAAGEVASAIACSTIIKTYADQPEDTPTHTRLALAIRSANDAVRHAALEDNQHGMGTTLVCAVVEGSRLVVGNVGDSRAYLFQNGATMQLTVDHSYINELVRQGAVRVEDIHTVNLKGMESVITRAIGAAHDVEPDFFKVDLKPNDTLLLASDGLTRYVDSGSLVSLVDPANLDASCERLIEAAKSAGGADNITCLLLRYDEVAGEVAEAPVLTPVESAPVESAPMESAPVSLASGAASDEAHAVEAALGEVSFADDLHLDAAPLAEDFFDVPVESLEPETETAAAPLFAEEPPALEEPAGSLQEPSAAEPAPAQVEEPPAQESSPLPGTVSFEDLLDEESHS